MKIDTKTTQDLFGYEYSICQDCEGTGEKSDSEDTCEECDGSGEITIKINW